MIALKSAIAWCVKHWECKSDHDLLLLHHLLLFREAYMNKLTNDQDNYGITFTTLEALAFCQAWHGVDLNYIKFEGVVVQEVLDQIDKVRKTLEAKALRLGNEPADHNLLDDSAYLLD